MRKVRISEWKKYAIIDIQESHSLIETAEAIAEQGFQKIESLHIACATRSECEYFLTTDDKMLCHSQLITNININDPIGFIKEVLS